MTETPPTQTNNTNMFSNPETNPHHPASPYYIQPGEEASSPLVPDLIITENYVTWARTMRRAMNIKNKLGFIDGKHLKPSNASDALYTTWERCNDMVIAWIQHSVCIEHRSSIAHVNTAAAVWNDLLERFSIQNAPRIFQLTKSISALTQDDESVMQFLMGLHDSFDVVRAHILLYDPLPALNRVLSLIQQEERCRQLNSTQAPIAMAVEDLINAANLPCVKIDYFVLTATFRDTRWNGASKQILISICVPIVAYQDTLEKNATS
ncbi:hypothetical protein F2P56_004755 [Juglans regia]|uniref:Retrotransposon Copia-like N-terminal domain-containing protein n=1 Tax=Juglans regia TaxID=51240 RepID=A0A833Y600_JUGRE|nr:hypothetical protein F2P56_004755 [Juglans regia]